MTVKRSRDDDNYRKVEIFAMTNCLMLLPSVGKSHKGSGSDRVFSCKTCNRKFSSFQALGGHRASHKKLKLMTSDLSNSLCLGGKPKKIHECPICGHVFPLGQALGGHMRRHRSPHHHHRSSSSSSSSGGGGGVLTDQAAAPVLLDDDESNRDRVVFFLDLNLSPHENDLKYVS